MHREKSYSVFDLPQTVTATGIVYKKQRQEKAGAVSTVRNVLVGQDLGQENHIQRRNPSGRGKGRG